MARLLSAANYLRVAAIRAKASPGLCCRDYSSAISINTVQGLIDHHLRLTAWCNACRHHDLLDLDALGLRGFDH